MKIEDTQKTKRIRIIYYEKYGYYLHATIQTLTIFILSNENKKKKKCILLSYAVGRSNNSQHHTNIYRRQVNTEKMVSCS